MKHSKIVVVLALIGLMLLPMMAQAADNIGSLVNPCFGTSWTYRSGGVPSPPGGWVLAGWGATTGGPQYYTGAELSSGRVTDHRCKWEFNGSGAGTNNVIAKEVNWGSYTSVTVTVYCAGRTWGSTNGTMSVGIDTNGSGTQWSDCGTNVTSRTSNDQSWATISKTVSKPGGATTFTVMLNAVPNSTTWNCQFDSTTITGTAASGAISGNVKDGAGVNLSGATVSTTSGGYTTSSDASGNYTLSSVAAGTYGVVASKSGYNSQTQTGKTVTAGATTTCNFTITRQTGTITGNVKDGGGANVSGATVYTGTGGYTTTTNSSGNYTLSSVDTGTYDVTASKSAYNSQTQTGKTVNNAATTTVNFTITAQGGSDVVVNGGFENGFTNNVGNNWTSFVSSSYSPTFADGTDQKYAGSHAQKITMPQPSAADKYAGIYQRLSTSAGSSYTLDAYARGNMPNETYAGEDLVLRLGYDLTGGTDYTSANVNWQEFNSVKDVWQSLTRSFTASGSYTTVYLQAWRKWAQHGTGYAWFDAVSCTGVSGTGAISGTVKNSSNVAISGATVSTTTGGYTTTTNASGAYTLSAVAPGTYSVVASKSGYNPSTQTGKTVTSGSTTTCSFTLTTASGNSYISGNVKTATGVNISGATVSTTTGGYSATTNASGNYTLAVAAGTYNVAAAKSGYQTHTWYSIVATSGMTTSAPGHWLARSSSKIGAHVVIGRRDGWSAFLQQCHNAGKGCAMVKCLDDFGAAYDAKTYSPETLTVGRMNQAPQGYDLQGMDYAIGQDPAVVAQDVFDDVHPTWDLNPSIDVWEIFNEWSAHWDWQADFLIAMMDIAEANGHRIALYGCSCGNPPEDSWPDIARACARAKAHGGHMLSLHEYSWSTTLQQDYIDEGDLLVTRYRRLYDYLRQNNADCPLVLTEVGNNGGGGFIGDVPFVNDMAWYDNQCRLDDYVFGIASWTLGEWSGANWYTALPEMGDYISTY